MIPRRLPSAPAALALFVALAARAQDVPDYYERRDADCIDQFNRKWDAAAGQLGQRAPEAGFVSNPLRFRALAGPRFVTYRNGDAPGLQQVAQPSFVADVEWLAPTSWAKSKASQVGISIAGEGAVVGRFDQPVEASGELRLGLARRRFQPTYSDPGLIYPRCRFARTDLFVDVVRVRLGAFNGRETSAAPSVFTASAAWLVLGRRWTYSDWGVAVAVSAVETRFRPSSLFGSRVSFDYDVGGLSTRLEVFSYWRNLSTLYVSLMAGFNWELGG